MTRPLIGLVGKKRSGKDTLAATLVEEYGFVRYAFADPLKDAALEVDPIVMVYPAEIRLATFVALRGWESAKELPEVRRLLQAFGVAVREHADPDVWLSATMRKVALEERPVVITDVRFPNEADAIESAGGVLVRVHRPGAGTVDAHVSETALDDRLCAWHVLNERGLTEMRETARSLAAEVLSW